MGPSYIEATREEVDLLVLHGRVWVSVWGGLSIPAFVEPAERQNALWYYTDPDGMVTYDVLGKVLRSDGIWEITYDDQEGEITLGVFGDENELVKEYGKFLEREEVEKQEIAECLRVLSSEVQARTDAPEYAGDTVDCQRRVVRKLVEVPPARPREPDEWGELGA